MKSIWIMFAGLGIAGWGAMRMWDFTDRAEGWAAAVPFAWAGGIVLVIGMLINQWEHTRRG
jgi:hypothetical protein